MKDIAIYGAGGLGRETACLIRIINEALPQPQWNLIGFFDDNPSIRGKQIGHYGPVIGGYGEANTYDKPLSVVLAIGSPELLKLIRGRISNANLDFPNLIHPDVRFSDFETFQIGEGNIIQGDCSFSCDTRLGNFNILNGSVVLAHDGVIGNNNVVMPNVRISGEVEIGEQNLIGACSFIHQGLHIGNRVTLSAGSILLTRPKDGCTYMGNPAKIFRF